MFCHAHLKSVYIYTLSHRLAKLGIFDIIKQVVPLPKEHRAEQAAAHRGVVTGVVTAVVRTVPGTFVRRGVRVVEHPKRHRRVQQP